MTEREIVCICNTYGGKYILEKTPTKSDSTEYRTRMAGKSGERNFASGGIQIGRVGEFLTHLQYLDSTNCRYGEVHKDKKWEIKTLFKLTSRIR
jgi:hypothetical protein